MKLIHSILIFVLTGTFASEATRKKVAFHYSKRGVNGPFIHSKAPHVNIFSGLSDDERSSITNFLNSQANVTMYVLSL